MNGGGFRCTNLRGRMIKHPAKFSDAFLPIFADLLRHSATVLDPLAGTGKLALIKHYGYQGLVYLNELEPEWARLSPPWAAVTTVDAAHLPYMDGWFAAICTSPTYANRMADHHEAKDGSRRNTYRHTLGRLLTNGNTGSMQWGDVYQKKHFAIWAECHRVLRDHGLFILNIKDHIRKGEIKPVTDWHIACLCELGFVLTEHRNIPVKGNGFGANGKARVGYESIIVFRKVAAHVTPITTVAE